MLMEVLLDTNILLRMAQTSHPMHTAAVGAVVKLEQAGHCLCIFLRNLYEYWVVCTRPLGEHGLGMPVEAAAAEMDRLTGLFNLRHEPSSVLARWLDLVKEYRVAGKTAHDAHLVAAMQALGIPSLLTFNVRDF